MRWIVGGTAAALAAGSAVVLRVLDRRRQSWRIRLRDTVPHHSAWWEEYHSREGELLYVAVGDSTAQGIGASEPGRSYVGELARYIEKQTGKTVRVANLSVSGSTVYGAYRDQLPLLGRLEPDILTVSIGANNIEDFEAERFERDLKRLFAGLPDHAIVAEVPSFYILPAEKKVLEANTIVRALAAERGFTVVPLHKHTKRQGIWGIATQFSGDLFHPNDRGYAVWARAFMPFVTDALHSRGWLPEHDGGAA